MEKSIRLLKSNKKSHHKTPLKLQKPCCFYPAASRISYINSLAVMTMVGISQVRLKQTGR